MATLDYQQIRIIGLSTTYAAADVAGDKVLPNARGFLAVKNASGASITATVDDPNLTDFGQATANITVTVPVGTTLIGPLPQKLGGSDGLVSITYSAVTSVTVAAVQL